MPKIRLSSIIKIDNPKTYKLHAARHNGHEYPLNVFTRSREEWVEWNTWRNDKNEFSRQFIFSLIDFHHEKDTWLFGGIFEIITRLGVKKSHSYEIKELTEYSDLVGRLKINLKKPPRGRAFYLEHHIDNMFVSEILKQSYTGEIFPGYEYINHDFNILSSIFKNEKADWKAALMNIKGIYVVSDKKNGKKYIGSAYGDSGSWSRWSSYLGNGHGDTDELTQLIKYQGVQYAKENFRLSLLEYRSMKVDNKIIIERETFWKEVFQSKGQFGYNKN